MTEDLLAYVWSHKLYAPDILRTTGDDLIEVISAGQLNRHGGPDFHHAMIRIGGRLWAGHVELHVRSSDWRLHGHERDDHYNSVILHVVYEHDSEVANKRGQHIPTLELKHVINPELIRKYGEWQENAAWIPCERSIRNGRVTDLTWSAVLDRMAAERLEDKGRSLIRDLHAHRGDWMTVFYRTLTRSLGFRTNAEAMASLAERLPWHTLIRLREDRHAMEALVYGIAGMLEDEPKDEYHADLVRTYRHQKLKSGYTSLDPVIWQWGRVRPSNLPSVRLAQLTAVISDTDRLRQLLFDPSTRPGDLAAYHFPDVSAYWNNHHRFGRKSQSNHAVTGRMAMESVFINAIAPIWFAYGIEHVRQDYIDKATELLQICSPETNHITRNWRSLGVKVDRAHDSQALLHLFHHYCSQKRCLRCGVGLKLLKET